MTIEVFLSNVADEILNPLIFLMFSVSLLVFFWGIYGYIRNSDNSDERKKGGKHIMYGLIGLVIMISAYTIVRIVVDTSGL